jgi:hypothetical protein
MMDDDVKKVKDKLSLKGDLLRVNPTLKTFGLGLDKGFMKQVMREAPGLLGPQFAGFAGGLHGLAAVLGPIGLGLAVVTGVAKHFLNAAKEADPEAAKAWDAAWSHAFGAGDKSPALRTYTIALERLGSLFGGSNKPGEGPFSEGIFGMSPFGSFVNHGTWDVAEGRRQQDEEITRLANAGGGKARLGSMDEFSDSLTIAAAENASYSDPVKDSAEYLRRIADMMERAEQKEAGKEDPDVQRAVRGF